MFILIILNRNLYRRLVLVQHIPLKLHTPMDGAGVSLIAEEALAEALKVVAYASIGALCHIFVGAYVVVGRELVHVEDGMAVHLLGPIGGDVRDDHVCLVPEESVDG